MERLFGAAISTRWKQEEVTQTHIAGSNLLLAEEFDLWWAPLKLPRTPLLQSSVTLSQKFFEQLIESPVPLDLRAITALKTITAVSRSVRLGNAARQLLKATAVDLVAVISGELWGRVRRYATRKVAVSRECRRGIA
jgi:hypothetical protein